MLAKWKERLSTHGQHLREQLAGYAQKAKDAKEGLSSKLSSKDYKNEVLAQTHAEVADMTTKLLKGETSHQQKFAAAFCYGCFTVFCFPLMSAWMLSFDRDVMYWFGTYVFWWTLPIPFGFIGVFFYHMRRGRLKRGMLLGSVIIPCVIFFLLGTSLRFKSEHLKDHLLSIDCQTFPLMKELEDASKEATQLYDKCNPHDYDVLFPACADFEKWRSDTENERTWDYLQHLETNCLCTGFCKPGIKPIWTHTKEWSHDPCNMCVVSAVDTHIWRVGEQMMAVGLIVLILFLIWHFFMEPSLMTLDMQKPSNKSPEPVGYGSLSSPKSLPQASFIAPAAPVSFRPARSVASSQVLTPVPAQVMVSSAPSLKPVNSRVPAQIPAGFTIIDNPKVRSRSPSPSMDLRGPVLAPTYQGVGSMPPLVQTPPLVRTPSLTQTLPPVVSTTREYQTL